MVFRVALVGHSQLPYIDNYDDVEFKRFKKGGARIRTFTQGSDYERICSDEWDCVILFLGGNDLCDHHNASKTVSELMRFVDAISAPLKLVTEIENRTYDQLLGGAHNIDNDQYKHIAKCANNKLNHLKRSRGFKLIHTPASYNIGSRDGIHLGETGERSLIARYVGTINRWRNA